MTPQNAPETICPDCGSVFVPRTKGKPRSYPQLQRFHCLMRAAYDNWPEAHTFRPKNVEHLRAWIEVEAGHFEVVKTVRCESADPVALTALLTAIMRATENDKVFIECDENLVIVKRALSISYAMLAHLSGCALFDQCECVIRTEMGIDPAHLLNEARNVA